MRAEAAHLEEQRAELRAQLKELVQRTLGGWNRVENLFLFAFARFFLRQTCLSSKIPNSDWKFQFS
jgi:hypothetical protein